MYVLEFVSGRPSGAAPYYSLVVRSPYTVGRSPSCDIFLDCTDVADNHASLAVLRKSQAPAIPADLFPVRSGSGAGPPDASAEAAQPAQHSSVARSAHQCSVDGELLMDYDPTEDIAPRPGNGGSSSAPRQPTELPAAVPPRAANTHSRLQVLSSGTVLHPSGEEIMVRADSIDVDVLTPLIDRDPLVVVLTSDGGEGTTVNGAPVTSPTVLTDGSVVSFGALLEMRVRYRPLVVSIAHDMFSFDFVRELEDLFFRLGATVTGPAGPTPFLQNLPLPIGLLHCAMEINDSTWSLLALASGYSIVKPTYVFEWFGAMSRRATVALSELPVPAHFEVPVRSSHFGTATYLRPESTNCPFSLYPIPTTAALRRSRAELFRGFKFILLTQHVAHRMDLLLQMCQGTTLLLRREADVVGVLEEIRALREPHDAERLEGGRRSPSPIPCRCYIVVDHAMEEAILHETVACVPALQRLQDEAARHAVQLSTVSERSLATALLSNRFAPAGPPFASAPASHAMEDSGRHSHNVTTNAESVSISWSTHQLLLSQTTPRPSVRTPRTLLHQQQPPRKPQSAATPPPPTLPRERNDAPMSIHLSAIPGTTRRHSVPNTTPRNRSRATTPLCGGNKPMATTPTHPGNPPRQTTREVLGPEPQLGDGNSGKHTGAIPSVSLRGGRYQQTHSNQCASPSPSPVAARSCASGAHADDRARVSPVYHAKPQRGRDADAERFSTHRASAMHLLTPLPSRRHLRSPSPVCGLSYTEVIHMLRNRIGALVKRDGPQLTEALTGARRNRFVSEKDCTSATVVVQQTSRYLQKLEYLESTKNLPPEQMSEVGRLILECVQLQNKALSVISAGDALSPGMAVGSETANPGTPRHPSQVTGGRYTSASTSLRHANGRDTLGAAAVRSPRPAEVRTPRGVGDQGASSPLHPLGFDPGAVHGREHAPRSPSTPLPRKRYPAYDVNGRRLHLGSKCPSPRLPGAGGVSHTPSRVHSAGPTSRSAPHHIPYPADLSNDSVRPGYYDVDADIPSAEVASMTRRSPGVFRPMRGQKPRPQTVTTPRGQSKDAAVAMVAALAREVNEYAGHGADTAGTKTTLPSSAPQDLTTRAAKAVEKPAEAHDGVDLEPLPVARSYKVSLSHSSSGALDPAEGARAVGLPIGDESGLCHSPTEQLPHDEQPGEELVDNIERAEYHYSSYFVDPTQEMHVEGSEGGSGEQHEDGDDDGAPPHEDDSLLDPKAPPASSPEPALHGVVRWPVEGSRQGGETDNDEDAVNAVVDILEHVPVGEDYGAASTGSAKELVITPSALSIDVSHFNDEVYAALDREKQRDWENRERERLALIAGTESNSSPGARRGSAMELSGKASKANAARGHIHGSTAAAGAPVTAKLGGSRGGEVVHQHSYRPMSAGSAPKHAVVLSRPRSNGGGGRVVVNNGDSPAPVPHPAPRASAAAGPRVEGPNAPNGGGAAARRRRRGVNSAAIAGSAGHATPRVAHRVQSPQQQPHASGYYKHPTTSRSSRRTANTPALGIRIGGDMDAL